MTTSVRRVRRIIRKIDPWTVLKVSFVFHAAAALAIVLGLVILWSVVVARWIPVRIDEIAQKITLIETGTSLFSSGEDYFRIAVFMAVVWTVAMTGLTTLAAVMYNLISDVVGGVEVVVLEETMNVPAAAGSVVRAPQRWQGTSTTPPPRPGAAKEQELADLPTQETSRV